MIKNKRSIIYIVMIFVLTYSLFGLSLVKEITKLPDSNWSRHIEIGQIEDCDIRKVKNHNSIVTMILPDKSSILTIYWNDKLSYIFTSLNGDLLEEGTFEWATKSKIDKIQVLKCDSDNVILNVLSKGVLSAVEINPDSKKIISIVELSSNTKAFKASSGVIIIEKDNEFEIMTKQNAVELSFNNLEYYELFTKGEYSYLVFTDVLENQKRHLKVAKINNETGENIIYNVDAFPNTTFLRTSKISMSENDNSIEFFYEAQDYRTGSSNIFFYSKDLNSEKEFSKIEVQDFGELSLEKIVDSNDNTVKFIARMPQLKGNSTLVENLMLFQLNTDNEELILLTPLTRTDYKSVVLDYFEHEGNGYLLWVDEENSKKTMFLGSNNQDAIKESKQLKQEEFKNIISTMLFSLFPILFATIFPTVAVIGPVVLILFLVSIKNLTWIENNSKKVIGIAIIVHTLIKINIAFKSIITESLMNNIESHFPVYLHNPFLLILSLLLCTTIAYLVNIIRIGQNDSREFWTIYIQFALTDMLMYGLLIMPYYYSYIGLTVFFS